MVIDKITIGPEIGLIVGTIAKIIIEEEETTLVIEVLIETTGPITEIVVGPDRETVIQMGICTTIDQTTEVTIVTKDIETEVRIMGRSREKGKNDATTFLSNHNRRGGTSHVKINNDKVLTTTQADFVNKELNAGNGTISVKKIVMQDKSVNTELDNTYQKAIVTENDKKKSPAQMKEWSILSDHVKYVTSDGSETFHKLNIDQMNYRHERDLYKELQEKELLSADVNFGGSPEKLKAEYLDVNEGVCVEMISTDRFDEDMDLSTTYLGQVDMTRSTEVKAEDNCPITACGYTKGKLLDDTECDILVDTGTSKSYMSKSYLLRCKSLHSLPNFTSTTTRIQVGNGQYVGALFVIPVIMTIQKHRFEISTLVSEIHENVDLVIGIKNLFELEGVIDSRDSCLSFLNRSIPFFPREKVSVKPK